MALQRLRNDPEAGWELRNRTPLWGPDFLMVSQECRIQVQKELFIRENSENGLVKVPQQIFGPSAAVKVTFTMY